LAAEFQTRGAKQGIRSVPTLVIFKDGQRVADHIGALSLGQLREMMENALA
jgi:thioredoxin-like negative regulator of GroEL